MKQFNVPAFYRSPLITSIKQQRRSKDKLKKDFTPTLLNFGPLHIYLARHFGFCYGVENAIEIAFRTVEENPGKNIYLLSEMIHNPQVNADLISRGVRFLMDTKGNELIPLSTLSAEDIVLIPAFGTTLEMESKLHEMGIAVEHYNTTCPFVEKVWNRSAQIAEKGYSVVVHGKPGHEETRATFSHSAAGTPTLVVKDIKETIELGKIITGERAKEDFFTLFEGRFSPGFDPEKDLQRIGVVNQTTMLASDTQEIAEYLKKIMVKVFDLKPENTTERFADTRDTLCYATNDNQQAVYGMLETPADIAIVVGGYNSSNTSHLVELCEEKLPTYFISDASKILSDTSILHYDFHHARELLSTDYLPANRPLRILMTSGASCPDALVEQVIERVRELIPGTTDPVIS
ncbi:4-hydroxy-3-methylbut-2-enyl diphosphate reductase [Parasegetibacter sp. NRK P23]|uniref:4-hydroxy-3-methylbut-2-enyl diphosphate reductase n=1 Tax=Parasegetibacter sp. NRK P23 TaxID=2942999 RepID=UPI0020443157|nr:4-hydroxy-3-methylbut-2-enyl diphosphate reductase [Parasegetibacter sp. NRK P23]MCM5528849.1 4-hydroxy-3-methylbut-2-enyl diphosphate reductase [Parasegetibacter sp. NRK P23]